MLLISVAQADSITTIQLQNRPAEEIIPIVKPMLGTNESISGRGFKLFLRSSPTTLEQVEDMIAALDISPKVLQISVFQGSTRGLSELGFSGNIQIESGDTSVSIGTPKKDSGDAGGSITYSTNRGSGSISGISTRKRLKDNPIHQIRVTEGNETGEQVPYFSGIDWIGRRGVAGGIEYKDVITGFYVLPRVHGDNVTLRCWQHRNPVCPNHVDRADRRVVANRRRHRATQACSKRHRYLCLDSEPKQ
jgi:hypothetical protein